MIEQKHQSRQARDEISKQAERINLTLDEMKRQTQNFSEEQERLTRFVDIIRKQNEDLNEKMEKIQRYWDNIQALKDQDPINDAATQAVQAVPNSTITEGKKRQRETLDGDEQTEVDEPRPSKKSKTPENTVPATASEDGDSGYSTCPSSFNRKCAQIRTDSKEAPSESMKAPSEVGHRRVFLQFNPDAVAGMVKRTLRDPRMSLGGLVNHQSPVVGPQCCENWRSWCTQALSASSTIMRGTLFFCVVLFFLMFNPNGTNDSRGIETHIYGSQIAFRTSFICTGCRWSRRNAYFLADLLL